MLNSRSNVLGYQWSGKKVLVTGASGFKGSWLCKVLLDLGAEVYAGVPIQKIIHPYSAYELLELSKKIPEVAVDISERQSTFDAVNTIAPDVIFHLAAKAQVPVAMRDPWRAFMVNMMGTLNILEACRELEIAKRVIIISTDHVFGDMKIPKNGFPESHPLSYKGPYDTSKSTMELAVRCYHKTYYSELPAIGITRAANVFGYGDTSPRRIIPQFINAAVKTPHEISILYIKNGRQFIYITDVIAGYIRAASYLQDDDPQIRISSEPSLDRIKRNPFTPTFHFALSNYKNYSENGEPFIRIINLANLIQSIVGNAGSDWCKEAGVCHVEINTDSAIDYAPNENPFQAINCSETCTKLDWEPKTDLEDGLTKMATWFLALNKNDISLMQRLINEESEQIREHLLN